MKYIATSDWHADWVSHGVRRFDEIQRAVEASLKVAEKENVDAYFFMGDLANPDNGAATIRAIRLILETAAACEEMEIPFFAVSGNHDVIEDGSGDTVLSPLYAMSALTHVFEQPRATVVNGFVVIGLPYPAATAPYNPSELDLVAMYREHAQRESMPCFVLSHLTNIPGVQRGEESSEMNRGRDVKYPVERVSAFAKENIRVTAIQGHFHKRQTVTFPNFTLEIPGALARLTFGEERHSPCFLLGEV